MLADWQPSCDLQHLRIRAQMLASIRQFFADRHVLEVETPLLCQHTGTDPQLEFFATYFQFPPYQTELFLQSSPEFAMKRLLAAGSGSIYQICKAFRNSESGRLHNPEFTILEWYRVGFDLPGLMQEVQLLLRTLFDATIPVLQIAYQSLFFELTGLDALNFEISVYQDYAIQHGFPEALALCEFEHARWLDFIFSHVLQAGMTPDTFIMVFDYPSVLSSLARVSKTDDRVTDRFEVFMNGIELGNGFYELNDAQEQAVRFESEILYRQQHNLKPVQKDSYLLKALATGLPDCSGIAIGLDRLLMLMTQTQHINQVLAFPLERA